MGDLLGLLVSFPLQGAIDSGAIDPSGAAAVLIVALVAAVMLALNDETRFLSWEMPQSYAGAVHAASAGEAKAGHLALRPQSVRDADGEGEGEGGSVAGAQAAGSAAASGASAGASPSASASCSQNPQPVDFIGQRVALLAREHKLTPRETEVFGLLAHGRSIPYVRDALIISRDTAATHAKHIYAKLDVHSRQELIDLVMSDEL